MNLDDDDLEARLQALRPAPLPEALSRRLQGAQPRRFTLLLLGAALAVVVLVILQTNLKEPTQPSPSPVTVVQSGQASTPLKDLRVYVPIKQTSTLVKVEDYGLLETDPQRPIQLMLTTWVDDVTYRGDDGTSLMQRQESRTEIVPVALHID